MTAAAPKPIGKPAVEPFWERLAWRGSLAILISAWFLITTAGFSTLIGLMASRWSPENGLLYGKLSSEVGGVGVFAAIATAVVLLGSSIRIVILRLRQKRFDRLANRILGALRSDRGAVVPSYLVYLRAFETTRGLNIPLFLRLRKIVAFATLTTNDIESLASGALRKQGPVVALGRPGEAFGAGRAVAPEDEWREDILLLLHRCRAILLIPSHRAGTLWEILSIRAEGLLDKCVFVMPPHSRKTIDTADRWKLSRSALAEMGLELPEYQNSGMLFTMAPDGRVSNVEPLILNSHRAVRRSVERLLRDREAKGGLFAAVAKADRRRRRARLFGWAGAAYYLSPLALAATNFLLPAPPGPVTPESWTLTFDRIDSYRKMSDWDIVEPFALNRSAKYREWSGKRSAEQVESERGRLVSRGLFRLDDGMLQGFMAGMADLFDRTDEATCASFAAGTIDGGAVQTALSYIPSDEMLSFLRARTEAILAEVEDRAAPDVDENGIRQASERFLTLFTPEERKRWERVNNGSKLSSADQCWLARRLYGGVKRLQGRDAANWARFIAALPYQDDPAPKH